MMMSIWPVTGKLRTAVVLAAGALLLACAAPDHQGAERRRELLVDGSRQIDVVVDGRGPAIVLLPSARRDSLDYDELAEGMVLQLMQFARKNVAGGRIGQAYAAGLVDNQYTVHNGVKNCLVVLRFLLQ